LASDIAQLIGVPVPQVDLGKVEQRQETFAISHIHSAKSRSVPEANLASSVRADAFREASGLLPLLAWIGAEDHNKAENFVVDDLGDNKVRIRAIDFEHAFHWPQGEDAFHACAIKELVGNANPQLVDRALTAIEGLTVDQIRELVIASGCAAGRVGRTVDTLVRRQGLLRPNLERLGWIAEGSKDGQ
jgi:hypothetical protein